MKGPPTKSSLYLMELAARKRIKRLCEEWTRTHAPKARMSDKTDDVNPEAQIKVTEYLPNGGWHSIEVSVSLRDPLTPEVIVFAGPLSELLRSAMDDITEVAEPRFTGAWWADEETYELQRAIYEGEELHRPPMNGWIAVDPTTYEHVNEVAERSLCEASQDDELPVVHQACIHLCAEAVFKNVERCVKEFKQHMRLLGNVQTQSSGGKQQVNVWLNHPQKFTFSNHADPHGWSMRSHVNGHIIVRCHTKSASSDCVQFSVSATKDWNGFEGCSEDCVKEVNDLLREIEEASQPQAQDTGLWWVDENMYMVRPLIEGELFQYKPDPLWTCVDTNTNDEVY